VLRMSKVSLSAAKTRNTERIRLSHLKRLFDSRPKGAKAVGTSP
jgi:hypothetical protein